MFPLVEFCISNMAKGSDVVFEKLENDPNIDVLNTVVYKIVVYAQVACMPL